jgi:hypothetical protein
LLGRQDFADLCACRLHDRVEARHGQAQNRVRLGLSPLEDRPDLGALLLGQIEALQLRRQDAPPTERGRHAGRVGPFSRGRPRVLDGHACEAAAHECETQQQETLQAKPSE